MQGGILQELTLKENINRKKASKIGEKFDVLIYFNYEIAEECEAYPVISD